MKTAFLAICLFIVSGCSHPFLMPESRDAVINAALPYVSQECKRAEIYAGYAFDWSNVIPEGINYENVFTGILGGCGKYVQIVCTMQSPCAVPGCEKETVCQTIQELQSIPK